MAQDTIDGFGHILRLAHDYDSRQLVQHRN
jgi:hypothetical protein